ncbi:MAG: CsbD family protein [Gammaproteobacteria bacterium]
MNWDRIEGNWKQATGKVKERWGKLTNDDLDVIAGRRDQLAGKIQERYGIAKDEAEKQLAAWERDASDSWFDSDQDTGSVKRTTPEKRAM